MGDIHAAIILSLTSIGGNGLSLGGSSSLVRLFFGGKKRKQVKTHRYNTHPKKKERAQATHNSWVPVGCKPAPIGILSPRMGCRTPWHGPVAGKPIGLGVSHGTSRTLQWHAGRDTQKMVRSPTHLMHWKPLTQGVAPEIHLAHQD